MREGRTRYISPGEDHCNQNCAYFFFLFLLVLLPAILYYVEHAWREKNLAFSEVRNSVEEGSEEQVSPYFVGKLVHVTTQNLKTEGLADSEFNFHVNGALKIRRITEYCQWQEFVQEREDDDGNKYHTYYYMKGWHSHPIASVLFDQPFHHHNPLRDPYPSREWVVFKAQVGAYTLTQPLVNQVAGYENINFRLEDVKDWESSEATVQHNFHPIGNGYFYSPYQETTGILFARLAGMFLEGSLDYQLGDLFSSCNSGDIRVYYQHISPKTVSVIGLLMDDKGTLGTLETSQGYHVGLVRPGKWGIKEMFDKELWDTWWMVLVARVVLGGLWGILFCLKMKNEILLLGMTFWGMAINLVMYLATHGIMNLIGFIQQYIFLGVVGSFGMIALGFYYVSTHHANLYEKKIK